MFFYLFYVHSKKSSIKFPDNNLIFSTFDELVNNKISKGELKDTNEIINRMGNQNKYI